MGTRRRVHFDLSGTPAEVLERMSDPAVAQARAASTPSLAGRVLDLGRDDQGRYVFTMSGSVPTDWLPRQVASAISTVPTITRTERWELLPDGNARTDLDLVISGVPAQAGGSARLEATPAGSRLDYEVGVEIAVPFLGSMIESAVLGKVTSALAREAEVI